MGKRIAKSVGLVGIVLIAAWVAFVVAMRTKYEPVLNAIRRMNRAVVNPRAMGTAGQLGAYASVVQHVGRTSGTEYETPIGVIVTVGGFLVALPYGPNVDWLRNVVAQGSAVIVHDGETYQVDKPEVISGDEVWSELPRKDQLALRLYGVDSFFRVQPVQSSLSDA